MADKELSILAVMKDKISAVLGPMTAEVRKFNGVLQEHNKNMKPYGDLMSNAKKAMMPLISGFVALSAAAIGAGYAVNKLMSGFAERGTEIYKLAEKTGMTGHEISQLGYAARQSEIDLDTLGVGLKFLMKNMQAAKSGDEELIKVFKALGVNLNGTPKEALLNIADAIADIKDPLLKTALELKIFGRSGQELGPLLDKGSAGINRMTEASDRFHISVSDAAVKGAQELEDHMKSLNDSWTGLKNTLAFDLAPYFENIINNLQDIIVEADKVPGKTESAGTSIRHLGHDIYATGTALDRANTIIKNSDTRIKLAIQSFLGLDTSVSHSSGQIGSFSSIWNQLIPSHKIFEVDYIQKNITVNETHDVKGTWGEPSEKYGSETEEGKEREAPMPPGVQGPGAPIKLIQTPSETDEFIAGHQRQAREKAAADALKKKEKKEKKPKAATKKDSGGDKEKEEKHEPTMPEKYGYGKEFSEWQVRDEAEDYGAEKYMEDEQKRNDEFAAAAFEAQSAEKQRTQEFMNDRLTWQDNEFTAIQQKFQRTQTLRDQDLISEEEANQIKMGLSIDRRKALNEELAVAQGALGSMASLFGASDAAIAKVKIPLEIAQAWEDFAMAKTYLASPIPNIPQALMAGAAGLAHLDAVKKLGEVKGAGGGGHGGGGRGGGGRGGNPPGANAAAEIPRGKGNLTVQVKRGVVLDSVEFSKQILETLPAGIKMNWNIGVIPVN